MERVLLCSLDRTPCQRRRLLSSDTGSNANPNLNANSNTNPDTNTHAYTHTNAPT
jgi:hypothetical protein